MQDEVLVFVACDEDASGKIFVRDSVDSFEKLVTLERAGSMLIRIPLREFTRTGTKIKA